MDEMEVEGMKGNIRHKVENGAPFKVIGDWMCWKNLENAENQSLARKIHNLSF